MCTYTCFSPQESGPKTRLKWGFLTYIHWRAMAFSMISLRGACDEGRSKATSHAFTISFLEGQLTKNTQWIFKNSLGILMGSILGHFAHPNCFFETINNVMLSNLINTISGKACYFCFTGLKNRPHIYISAHGDKLALLTRESWRVTSTRMRGIFYSWVTEPILQFLFTPKLFLRNNSGIICVGLPHSE